MLVVLSLFEDDAPVSKAARERTWEAFLAGGTNHSARAQTLGYIIRRCENEKRPYRLTAMPGVGYFIAPIADEHHAIDPPRKRVKPKPSPPIRGPRPKRHS